MGFNYFNLGDAFDDFTLELEVGNIFTKVSKLTALAGKTVVNVGALAVEAAVDIAKNAPEHMGNQADKLLKENSDSLTDEQKRKLEDVSEKGRKHRGER